MTLKQNTLIVNSHYLIDQYKDLNTKALEILRKIAIRKARKSIPLPVSQP